jgi:glutamate synthase (NADPH/NADH) small chain
VFAGGDAVTGAATVILAAGAGKRAAHAIHDALVARRATPVVSHPV